MFKALKRALHLNNVIINSINQYENVNLYLHYNIEEQKKITLFKILDNLRYYVILSINNQNRILKKNLIDKDIASQSSIQT